MRKMSACASVVLLKEPLTRPWFTESPYIFSAYHNDVMPKGNAELGPDASLEGRNIGADFGGKDGWNMYHGTKVSGFPVHPHRGFETLTIVRQGYIDHADSLGNGGRFGAGDCQWMTAGAGICHSEMSPCLNKDGPNPTELFQIWINLPAAKKMVEPAFKMLWNQDIPILEDNNAKIKIIAGNLQNYSPPSPPPDSYASDSSSHMLILQIEFNAHGGSWTLPPITTCDPSQQAYQKIHRNLYFFQGETNQHAVHVAGQSLSQHCRIKLRPDLPCTIETKGPASFLLLQGKDIEEPIVQHGPFVGNTQDDILRAFEDYRRTKFGKWPWPQNDVVHPADAPRFATYPDGSREQFPLVAPSK